MDTQTAQRVGSGIKSSMNSVETHRVGGGERCFGVVRVLNCHHVSIDSHHLQTLMSTKNRHCVSGHPERCIEQHSVGNGSKQFDDFGEHHWFVSPAHQQPPGQHMPPGFLPG